MKAQDILKHITGISTPIGGIQWTPPPRDADTARKLIIFLEDRRVLFQQDDEKEGAAYCRQSVESIRDEITKALNDIKEPSEIGKLLRSMRSSCRRFCDSIGDPSFDKQPQPVQKSIMKDELDKLRNVTGKVVGALSVTYQLDVEDDLAGIIPLSKR